MNIHTIARTPVQIWFTAQEMADAAANGILTGIPTTKRGINEKAERENWKRYHALVKTEKDIGGTITRYHIELLPLPTRVSYLMRFIVAEPDDVARPVTPWENLTDRARLSRDARLAIVRMADRFHRANGLTVLASDGFFADIYNAGRVSVPEWVREVVGKLSIRSIMRWRSKERETGANALAHDPAANRKGKGLLETANGGDVKQFILAWLVISPAVAASEIAGYVEDEFGAELVDAAGELKPLPPLRTFQHFIAALKASEKVVLTAINNPDKYRSHYRLRGTGSYSWVTEANQLWMIDASPGDALLIDGRHSIYVCIDVATRDLTITVSKTPRASAVGLLMRKAILRSGLCRMVKTDNGSDFVAVETQRLFLNLDIEAERSAAFTPEEKAFVERAIKTVQHKFFTQLPGYIGHSVTERKAIEDKKSFAQRLGESEAETFSASLTAAELQEKIDDWLEHVYRQKKHGGLFGKTPAQALAERADTIRRVDARALDMLLMPVAGQNGRRKMTAQGIGIGGEHYLCGSILPGTEVFVRMDPEDMGKAYVYTLDGREFLDEAICAKLSNINRAAFVKAKKQEFNAMVAEKTRAIKAEVRALQKGPSGIDRTIRLAKSKSDARAAANANVIALPKREEAHSTPQIAAALDAVEAPKRRLTPKPLNARAADLHAAIVREAEEKAAAKVIHLDPDAGLSENARSFKWALALETQIAAGTAIPDAEAVRLVRFQSTAEYQAMKDCLGDFGLERTLKMF